jgi:hypothetical protein
MVATTAHARIVVAAHMVVVAHMPCFATPFSATPFSAAAVGPSHSRSVCVTISTATLVPSLVPFHGGPIRTPIPVPPVVVASFVPSFPSASCVTTVLMMRAPTFGAAVVCSLPAAFSVSTVVSSFVNPLPVAFPVVTVSPLVNALPTPIPVLAVVAPAVDHPLVPSIPVARAGAPFVETLAPPLIRAGLVARLSTARLVRPVNTALIAAPFLPRFNTTALIRALAAPLVRTCFDAGRRCSGRAGRFLGIGPQQHAAGGCAGGRQNARLLRHGHARQQGAGSEEDNRGYRTMHGRSRRAEEPELLTMFNRPHDKRFLRTANAHGFGETRPQATGWLAMMHRALREKTRACAMLRRFTELSAGTSASPAC